MKAFLFVILAALPLSEVLAEAPTGLTGPVMQAGQFALALDMFVPRPVNNSAREIDSRPDGPREVSRPPEDLTAYGVNLVDTGAGTKVRGGVSDLSDKAAAGVELIVTW